MNTTVETMQEYILNEYGIEFKLVHYFQNSAERWLIYKKNKKEYELHCDYANHPVDECYCWSIYHNYMDYEKWYGYGGAEIDRGVETIDKIMKDWGFSKNNQLCLF